MLYLWSAWEKVSVVEYIRLWPWRKQGNVNEFHSSRFLWLLGERHICYVLKKCVVYKTNQMLLVKEGLSMHTDYIINCLVCNWKLVNFMNRNWKGLWSFVLFCFVFMVLVYFTHIQGAGKDGNTVCKDVDHCSKTYPISWHVTEKNEYW